MLIPIGSDLYIHDGQKLRLLVNGTNQPPIIDPKLSPDGSLVAYVQDCELYCISTSDPAAQPRQLTFDARGRPNKTNGLAEFIAQEEMNRSDGFWWSDNSQFIAFTQVDESNIPVFRISHSGSDDPEQVNRKLRIDTLLFLPALIFGRSKSTDIRSLARPMLTSLSVSLILEMKIRKNRRFTGSTSVHSMITTSHV
jgi:hypothetical protein